MAEETEHEIPVEMNEFDEAFRTDELIFMRQLEPISGLYSEEQLATLNETPLLENEVSNFTSTLGISPPFMPTYPTLTPQPWWIESLVETELGLFYSAVDNREQLPTGLNKELHPQHCDECMQK
ncbi:uncharacterized protein LDX57_000019 [Aspergillus melleus]|uniref:uncharacterized protein n=1 Tax=Aspergillus melleus TaxID=138277 RepID=UPI001E8DFC73|nr:uncharacterized protein LDX57_000019 [Aspergillus melleus]KAH8422261.1 hypothetical protein LDX57_000019 [Aspergillus melleus]